MVVVTGGTGHIGNVLVRLLVGNGYKVRVVIPPYEDLTPIQDLSVDVAFADVRDVKELIEAFSGAEAVFHLASLISIFLKDDRVYEVNVNGVRNVIEACFRNGIKRLIYVSSVHAFKEEPLGIKVVEQKDFDPNRVTGDYAKSKAIATKIVLNASKFGIEPVVVHPSGVIGPYDYKLSFMNKVIIDFFRKPFLLSINGAYNFVDVRDVANGIFLAFNKGRPFENYILSGENLSINQLFSYLEEISQTKKARLIVPSNVAKFFAYFADYYYRISKEKPTFTSYAVYTLGTNSNFSYEKASSELGYKPRAIKETVKDTIDWFKMRGMI